MRAFRTAGLNPLECGSSLEQRDRKVPLGTRSWSVGAGNGQTSSCVLCMQSRRMDMLLARHPLDQERIEGEEDS